MGNLKIIWTNRILGKMKYLGLAEAGILDVFYRGEKDKSKLGGWKAIKKYPGREIGVYYKRKPTGEYMLISAWKRGRR